MRDEDGDVRGERESREGLGSGRWGMLCEGPESVVERIIDGREARPVGFGLSWPDRTGCTEYGRAADFISGAGNLPFSYDMLLGRLL